MAGIAIPDNLRPVIAAVVKYHFWILAALAPLVLVPLLFMGTGSLRSRIASQRSQIDAKLNQARSVTAVQPHPNEQWRIAIDTDIDAVSQETRDEWLRFWHSQRSLRTWPAELGEPFLAAVAALPPGGKLDRRLLIAYQNMAPRLVRSLPRRMGVRDEMTGEATAADAARGAVLTWSAASQQQIFKSFVWTETPNTTQVLLAQEELWVYGVFCDLLGRFVRDAGATGVHDSPLTVVENLVIGFPAATPAAAKLFIPTVAAGDMPPMPMDSGPAQAVEVAPLQNPRFTGGAPAASTATPEGQPAALTEEAYREGIYVDFTGKQLSVADLAAVREMQLVHLMPFVLRVTIDQRHLDRLLVALATAPIPIDVREVRVTHGAGGADMNAPSARPNDLVVELRGSVALATRPEAAPAAPDTAEVAP